PTTCRLNAAENLLCSLINDLFLSSARHSKLSPKSVQTQGFTPSRSNGSKRSSRFFRSGESDDLNCLNVLNDLNHSNYFCRDSQSFRIHFCASSWRAPNLGSASGKPYSTPGTRRCSGTTSPSGMSFRNDDRSMFGIIVCVKV